MPPTTDDDDAAELRDAVASLRRLASGENLAEVYPEFTPHNVVGALCLDRGTVAHAWLAANPADDGEAIDANWLTASGLPQTLSPAPEYTHERYAADLTAWRVTVVRRPLGDWRMFAWATATADHSDQSASAIVRTRGQLRRLLAALGVPLPNPTDPDPEE